MAVPYEQEDENTLAIAIGGVPPGTPIRIDAVLPDGREVHEVLPNLPSTANDTTDTDADGMVNRSAYLRGSHPNGTFARSLAEGANSECFDMRWRIPESCPRTCCG